MRRVARKLVLWGSDQVIFDEFEETITEENKEYIDIATDKVVIEKLSKTGLLHYFILFTSLSSRENTLYQTLPCYCGLKPLGGFL